MPLISVLMPMKNTQAYVEAAAESVLAQEDVDLELIIVDDGSTDRSREIVEALAKRDPRVRVLDGPRQGIAMSLNTALAGAKGEIVCRCDSDDLYEPGRLAWQSKWLAEHPDFGAVCASFSMIDSDGEYVHDMNTGRDEGEITSEMRAGKLRTHFCTFATRTQFLRQINGSRPYFEHAEDIDLQLRLGEACRVWYVPKPVLKYRIHDASITHQQPNERRQFLDQLARECQKDRMAGRDDVVTRGCPPGPPAGRTKPMSAADHLQRMLVGRAWQEHAQGRRFHAIWTGVRAWFAQPLNAPAFRNLAALIVRSIRPT